MKPLDRRVARRWCALGLLGILLAVGAPLRAADSPRDADEELLKEAGCGADAASLLRFLRDRSRDEADPGQIPKLIRQLGSDNFADREQAAHDLVLFGGLARPRLQRAAEDPDVEIARRAKACLQQLQGAVSQEVPAAAVRLLLQRRPAGTVEALLRYLPFVREEALEVEIAYGLEALAVTGGKLQSALLAALRDKAPARRALAACLVGHHGDSEARAAVRKLLADAEPLVRLRAAQGLLAARDKAALPVLIALLDEPAVEISWQAEELLHWAAGDSAPEAVVGAATAVKRRCCREAWEAWQRQHGADIDLTKIDARLRRVGLLLLCRSRGTHPNDKTPGGVWLRGCDGKPRWHLQGSITDVQLLPGNRVLLCEEQRDTSPPVPKDVAEWMAKTPEGRDRLRRLTEASADSYLARAVERDLQGSVLWQAEPSAVASHAQRLADGNTFITHASKGSAAFVGPDEKLTSPLQTGVLRHPGEREVLSPTGETRMVGLSRLFWADGEHGLLAEYDPLAKRHRRMVWFDDRADTAFRTLDVLPNGHWLVGDVLSRAVMLAPHNSGKTVPHTARVREIDTNGKTVWQYQGVYAASAARVPNGNTVLLRGGFWGIDFHPDLFEVDAAGKKVWEDLSVGHVNTPGKKVWEDFTGGHNLRRVRVCLPLVRLGFDQPAAAPLDLDAPAYRVKGLKDKDPEARWRAAQFLKELGPKAAAVLPELAEALKAEDPDVSWQVAEILGKLGPKAAPVIPELVEALADSDWRVVEAAFGALEGIGPTTLPAILEALQDKRALVRAHALGVLNNWKYRGQIPKGEIKSVVRKMLAAVHDEDAFVRRSAVSSLKFFADDSDEVLPALVAALKDKEVAEHPRYGRRSVAQDAANALISFRARAVPPLLEATKDEDRELSDAAIRSLGWIGARDKSVAPTVVPALINILEDETQSAKHVTAMGALALFGPEAKPAVPALRKALRVPPLRLSAVGALRDIGPGAEAAIPDVLALAQDKGQEVLTREEAIRALASIGPAAKSALPFLSEVANDRREDIRLRTAANNALKSVQR
jgi:HEAT repeat protein